MLPRSPSDRLSGFAIHDQSTDTMEDQIAFYSSLKALPTPPGAETHPPTPRKDADFAAELPPDDNKLVSGIPHSDSFHDLQAKLSSLEIRDSFPVPGAGDKGKKLLESPPPERSLCQYQPTPNEITGMYPHSPPRTIHIPSFSAPGRSFHTAHDESRDTLEEEEEEEEESKPLSRHLSLSSELSTSSTNWSQLTTIDLTHTSIPESVKSEFLPPAKNLPKWLSACDQLQYLIIPHLGLRTIDEWVSVRLTQLKVLDVSHNEISIWPDHLVRLLKYGNLLELNLDHNPCVNKLRERSEEFATQMDYINGRFDIVSSEVDSGDNTQKKSGLLGLFKSKGKAHPSPPIKKSLTFDNNQNTYPRSRLGSVSSEYPFTYLYSASGRNDSAASDNSFLYSSKVSDNTDTPSLQNTQDELLDPLELSSLSSSLNSATPSWTAWSSYLALAAAGFSHPISTGSIARSQIYFHLLRDVWELTTQEPILPPLATRFDYLQYPIMKKTITAEGKVEAFTAGTLNHATVWASMGNPYIIQTPTRAPVPNVSKISACVYELVERERAYIKYLQEMVNVFVKTKTNPGYAHIRYVFDPYVAMLKFHTDFMVDLMQFSSELYDSGKDPMLNRLGDAISKAFIKLDKLYKTVGEVVMTALMLEKFWYYESIVCISSSPYGAYYGGENFHVAFTKLLSIGLTRAQLDKLGFNAQNFKQPDLIALGSWYRSAAKSKKLTMGTLADYLKLPLRHMTGSLHVFKNLETLGPGINICSELVSRLADEVGTILLNDNARLKLNKLRDRYINYDIQNRNQCYETLFSDSNNTYMTDFIITLFDKTYLVPNEYGDTFLKRAHGHHRNKPDGPNLLNSADINEDLRAHNIEIIQAPCLVSKMLQPPSQSQNIYRVIVLSHHIIVCDESNSSIVKAVPRDQVVASLPTPFRYKLEGEGEAEYHSGLSHSIWTFPYSRENKDRTRRGGGVAGPKTSRKGKRAYKKVPRNLIQDNSLRILFLEEEQRECWHGVVQRSEVIHSASVPVDNDIVEATVGTINFDILDG